MLSLHLNGYTSEDSDSEQTGKATVDQTEMNVDSPARLIQDCPEELIKSEEEACEHTQDSLNSSLCLKKLEESFNEGIDNPIIDGMDAVKETKSTSGDKTATELEELLVSLQHLQERLTDGDSQQDIQLLMELLLQSDFQQAYSMHRSVALSTRHLRPPYPLTAHAQQLREEVEIVLQCSKETEATELTGLLTSLHLQALMEAHDCIAEQEFDVDSNEAESQYGKTTKLVCLEKTRDMPLGVTVRNEHDRVIVSRVVSGGTAEKSSLLSEGDEILEINDVPVRGKSVNDVHNILSSMHGPLTFLLIPNSQNKISPHTQTVMHVKANFNYDPSDDRYVPCRELSLAFQKGDVLHVISQDDPDWWQAYRDGDEDQKPLAGLIPGKSFQQQREAMKKTITDRNQEQKGKLWCARKNKNQRKKLLYNPNKNIDTTRNPRMHEVNGREYHFVSRQNFESDLSAGKFIESGEFDQNLYGTNTDSVRQVINSGKICVLCLHPRSLRVLRSSDLKPYVIFIRPPTPPLHPPSQERRPTLLTRGGKKHMPGDGTQISEKAREMEHIYGHLFDIVITNSDQDKSVFELLRLIDKLDTEPQWVPSAWYSVPITILGH
ncbi:protein PALS1-like isoform X3 [Myxocyprinus asiaticus]|uniref:protein PALS1-like isoform X3 n=1 Tax=Myxocyprinus asiaticus TaxID=70543 RepID=UPI0022214973|nr:protein PALS1-like isoform X3 [Myxocyprinus asiaticus]